MNVKGMLNIAAHSGTQEVHVVIGQERTEVDERVKELSIKAC